MLNIKALLIKMLGRIDYTIDAVNIVNNGSASTYYNVWSKDVSKTGYKPIALTGVGLNQAILHTYLAYLSGTTVGVGVCKNTASGTLSTVTITAYVLYVKE